MKNSWGSGVTMTIFGESHGAAIGAVLDGIAAGIPVDMEQLAASMDRRRARGDGLSTARTEPDEVSFLSGVVNGHTVGTAIALTIANTNTRSQDYAKTAFLARPGHADYAAHMKYEGFEDARGGGHFSGRVTAAAVAAGSLCQQILAAKGIGVYTHIAEAAGLADAPLTEEAIGALCEAEPGSFALLDPAREKAMRAAILRAGQEGDSVGGVLETVVTGLPAGLGEPWFDSAESVLAHLAFSIPAVKGIEFGAGFRFARLRGSEANDAFRLREGRIVTATNRNGGVNGGITNGMPLVFRTALKPTPSIYKPQDTVNLETGEEEGLRIHGRHDPCIVPRAAVVQTALTAFGILDLATVRFGTLWQRAR